MLASAPYLVGRRGRLVEPSHLSGSCSQCSDLAGDRCIGKISRPAITAHLSQRAVRPVASIHRGAPLIRSADDACCMGRCLENAQRQCIADRQWLGGRERHRQGISDRFRCCYRLAEHPICRPWFIIYKNYEQPLSSVNNAREQQKKTSEKPFS